MKSWPARACPRALTTAAILALLLGATSCAGTGRVRAKGIAVHPTSTADPAEAGTPSEDGALLTHLVLSVTPWIDVRLQPRGAVDPDLLHVVISPSGARGKGRALRALQTTRHALQAIPKKRWRKRSLKRLALLDLDSLGERRLGLLLDALKARSVGSPARAAALLQEAVDAGPAPLLQYLLAAALLETGDLGAAADALGKLGEASRELPPPMRHLSKAVLAASEGEAAKALRFVHRALRKSRALSEAYWLRARIAREACDLYRHEQILADLDRLLLYQPCCAACTMDRAEMEAFTGQPWQAEAVLSGAEGCVEEALDSVRDRAMALALAAAGSFGRALDAAARAEARGPGSLRAGLGPAFLLSGDHARLAEASGTGFDPGLPRNASLQQHLYGGLNHLWQGRPSAAAEQFERGEGYARELLPEGWAPRGTVQLLVALRIRALLTAGRHEEAVRLAEKAEALGDEGVIGFVIYTGAMAKIAAGSVRDAQREVRRLITADEKPWLYLIDFEARLGKGRLRRARVAMSNALLGIDTEINFCPGIPMEPYVLHAQARLLLAEGRPEAAERILRHMVSLGARGIFAPDLLVPAWELIAEAREAQGDRAGALEAYREILARWSEGERIPLLARTEERIRALSGDGAGGPGSGTP